MPKIGDVVLYRTFGRVVNALVLGSRDGDPSLLGANEEPTLTLALVDPARELAIAPKKNTHIHLPETQLPQVYIEHDVVHASHQFSDEFKEKNHVVTPAQIASWRGHGEWLWVYPHAADLPSAADLDAVEAENRASAIE